MDIIKLKENKRYCGNLLLKNDWERTQNQLIAYDLGR